MQFALLAVYDSKAKVYAKPFFAMNVAVGIRMFTDAVNDESTELFRHPGDFTLFHLGTFDDQTGGIVMNAEHVNCGLGTRYSKERQ